MLKLDVGICSPTVLAKAYLLSNLLAYAKSSCTSAAMKLIMQQIAHSLQHVPAIIAMPRTANIYFERLFSANTRNDASTPEKSHLHDTCE